MLKLKKKKNKASGKPDFKIKEKVSEMLTIYDVPLSSIELSEDNPNQEDDKTFDQLVEKIRVDGFDEPVHIMPKANGKYAMVSGEHRYKAAKYLGFPTIPAVIHLDWDDKKRKIELVARNMLRGSTNPEKFTKLFNELQKAGLSSEILKTQMGFTKKDAFDKLYKSIESSVTPAQKKQLGAAKETIKSVDDLSSVLNTIFKDHGSELDHGFMVFSYGGKNHHYIPVDKQTDGILKAIESHCVEKGLAVGEFFRTMLIEGFVQGADKRKRRIKK